MLWYASHDNKVRLSRSQFWVMVNNIDHLAVMHVGVPVTTRVLVFIDDSLKTQDIYCLVSLYTYISVKCIQWTFFS